MPLLELHVPPDQRPFREGFERIRRELGVVESFPDAVDEHARAVARRGPRLPGESGSAERGDDRGLPFVTIDPPGSRDLDQAFHAEHRGDGYRVFYAIADVAAFVAPGDPVDAASLERGVAVYAPDRRAPLHPPVLSEGVDPGTVSDPLPQAMVLTAIVITFGVTAFLLALALRSYLLTGSDEVEDDLEDRRIAASGETST